LHRILYILYNGSIEQSPLINEHALKIAREIGDIRNEGVWLGNLGNAYSALGDAKKPLSF